MVALTGNEAAALLNVLREVIEEDILYQEEVEDCINILEAAIEVELRSRGHPS